MVWLGIGVAVVAMLGAYLKSPKLLLVALLEIVVAVMVSVVVNRRRHMTSGDDSE